MKGTTEIKAFFTDEATQPGRKTVRVEFRVDDEIQDIYEQEVPKGRTLERALTNVLKWAREDEVNQPATPDEIDAQVMEDFTRLRRKGHTRITLVLEDLDAHESICSGLSIFEQEQS